MEYFRKYFKEIVTIVVLLMGVYFLVLITIVQSKFKYYSSGSFTQTEGHYEYLGSDDTGGHTVLNKRTGELELRIHPYLRNRNNRYLKDD